MKIIHQTTKREYTEPELLRFFGLEVVHESALPTIDSTENNGGTTDYYALPLPAVEKLIDILDIFSEGTIDQSTTIDLIRLSCISTLNDLIEYRDMPFWEGEILKAIYALHQRANKDIKGGGILRELNKIKYYVERGIALVERGKI